MANDDPGHPGIADNACYRDWYTRFIKLAANPYPARRLAEMNADAFLRSVAAEPAHAVALNR